MKWRKSEQFNKILVSPHDTLAKSLPCMDETGLQVLLVVNEFNILLGIITDGDVRRALLNGYDLNTPLNKIMHINPRILPANTPLSVAKDLMATHSIKHIPLIDEDGKIKDLIIWSDCFQKNINKHNEKVIIMAGGKGTRLDPFTKILPKPMIPLGDKPIIEVIMDKFYKQGFFDFILSLGYKAEIIKMYFAETNNRSYRINYIYEEQPLGTAGALNLLKDDFDQTFIVTNCDVIFEVDYHDLLEYHRNEKNVITIVSCLKDFTIPYGVLKTDGQQLLDIDEKPSFHFLVNMGLYVLEPEVLNMIKKDEFIHMTDLLMRIKDNGGKVGVYPYYGKWFDVGHWEDYRNTLRHFGSLE